MARSRGSMRVSGSKPRFQLTRNIGRGFIRAQQTHAASKRQSTRVKSVHDWGGTMRKFLFLFVGLHFCANVFAQTGTGSVGGIITDQSRALLPGVSLSLTNTDTGVASTQISNESGSYQFQAVPPGNYRLTASLPSFKQAVASVVVGTN